MNTNATAPKGFFKTLTIIYGALIVGILVFTALTYLSVKDSSFSIDTDTIFIIAIPLITIAGYFLSNLLYKFMLGKLIQLMICIKN